MLISSYNASADVFVNGYTKKNGTYVEPHYRSSPDNSIFNNYSYQQNSNSYGNRTLSDAFNYHSTKPSLNNNLDSGCSARFLKPIGCP